MRTCFANLRGGARLIVVAIGGFALSGCIAAALPLAAGGLLVRTTTDGSEATAAQRQDMSTAPPATAQDDPASARAAATGDQGLGVAEGASFAIVPDMSALPPPTPGRREPTVDTGAAYAPLLAYMKEITALPTAHLPSAVLKDSAALDPERTDCNASVPTVLFDLDPDGGLFDPAMVEPATDGLAEHLTQMRAQGISIAWISGHSADMAGDIRIALKSSGLDPQGDDRLLLMRYPGERKQTRRAEFAETECLYAIAGDARSDFDELYDYIVDPSSAFPLDRLFGAGWFLVPTPLAANGALASGDSAQ